MNNTQKARLLRKSHTDAEKVLWLRLRDRRLEGYKFRRQAPIGPYVADFMCQSSCLIVEVDGGQHAGNREYDQYRTDFLRARGYKVIRFWNNEVTNNLDGVLRTIAIALSENIPRTRDHERRANPDPLPQGGRPHPTPLPKGEGKQLRSPTSLLSCEGSPYFFPLPVGEGGGEGFEYVKISRIWWMSGGSSTIQGQARDCLMKE